MEVVWFLLRGVFVEEVAVVVEATSAGFAVVAMATRGVVSGCAREQSTLAIKSQRLSL